VETFYGGHRGRVERSAPIVQHGRVRDFVGEGVFECVLFVGEQAGLMDEFCRPQIREAATERLFMNVCNRVKDRIRDVLADHGRSLQ
jgi:hypothetical protein